MNHLKIFVSIFFLTLITDIDAKKNEIFETVKLGNVEAVKKVLKKTKVSSVVDENDRTPLFYLRFSLPTAVDIAQLLVEAGVDVNASQYNGQTILMYLADKYTTVTPPASEAEKRNYLRVMKYLLKNGAKKNIPDHEGRDFATYFPPKKFKKVFGEEQKENACSV